MRVEVKETKRLLRLREREERQGWVQGTPKSAADALRTAIEWNAEIAVQGISRADIARRERLTRARVTQVMSLLNLPDHVKATMLGGEAQDWSVRTALRQANAARGS